MSTVHVLPVGDVIDHHIPGGLDGHDAGCADCRPGEWLALEAADDGSADTDCPCGPTPELVADGHGPDGWLVTHHTLDGREQRE